MSSWNPTPDLSRPQGAVPVAAGVVQRQRMGGASPYGSPFPLGEDPFSTAQRFNTAYGGMAPHAVAQSLQTGNPVQANPATTTTIAPAGAPAPTATPEQAGQMNATAPGVFNGNPANGYPSADAGFAPQSPQPPAGPPQPPKMPQPKPQWAQAPLPAPRPQPPAPAPAPPPPGTRQTMGTETPAAPSAGKAPLSPEQIKAMHPEVTDEMLSFPGVAESLAQGSDPFAATVQASSPTSGVVMKAAAAGGDTAAGGETIGYGGTTYTLNKPKPANWNQWDDKRRQDWLAENATVRSDETRRGAQEILNDTQFANLKLPTVGTVPGQGTVTPDMTQAQLNAMTGGDQSLNTLVLAGQQLFRIVNNPPQDIGNNPAAARALSNQMATFNAVQNALKAYGISFGATPTAPPPGDGTSPPGGDGSTPPTTPTTPTDGATGPGGTVGGPDFPGSNLDLSNLTPTDMKGMLALFEQLQKTWGDKAPAIFEGLMSAAQQQNKQNNVQSAVDALAGAGKSLESSPLYTGSQKLAGDILANPDPTDWNLVQNKSVAESGDILSNYLKAASASQRNRGISADSQEGMLGDIYRQHAGDVAERLGDLRIQESQQKRQAQMDALRTALTTMAGTTGASMGNVTNIANILSGNSANDTNPFSGVASAFANIDAIQAQIDAAEDAGKLSWQDAFNALVGGGSKVAAAALM